MTFKKLLTALALLGMSAVANAATFDYVGSVDTATGAFEGLTPVGTNVAGIINIDDAAVAAGTAGAGDLADIAVNVGNFCFFFGAGSCPGAQVPIESIDNANITFSGNGDVTGGTFDVTAFSPTLNVSLPITFDLSNGTFFADGGFLGTVSGTGTLSASAVVPVPAAVWLLGSGLLGLMGLRRK